jgi:hypothetical protein
MNASASGGAGHAGERRAEAGRRRVDRRSPALTFARPLRLGDLLRRRAGAGASNVGDAHPEAADRRGVDAQHLVLDQPRPVGLAEQRLAEVVRALTLAGVPDELGGRRS